MIKAFIVDDETPARNELAFLLEETGRVVVVGEAGDVRAAVELIKNHSADVIFLDINMPGFSGIQLAEVLKSHPNPPAIIFVTAYSNFALQAFEVNAIDYLIKPVDTERLNTALDKIKKPASQTNAPDYVGSANATRVTVNKGGKKHFISSSAIIYLMAKDDYSYIHTDEGKFLSTTSLTHLEEQLTGFGFFRVHRRYVVNLDRIVSIAPQSGGTLLLTLGDGEATEVPVSRRRVAILKQDMGI
ncbi:MAG: response regulator transcription factor [Coriobacteriia bacterium]|nr:response regulator transcription factor [Coriobacteriia bacterium]